MQARKRNRNGAPIDVERLVRLRHGKGMTQAMAAAAVGVSRVSWGRYETGKMRPGPTTLLRIARTFGVEASVLMR